MTVVKGQPQPVWRELVVPLAEQELVGG